MADKYIQYAFAVEDIIDRVTLHVSGAAYVYVAYSDDEVTWNYLKAEADHTLDSDGELLVATGSADAATNYWTVAAGKNIAIFPNMIAARYCRLYLTNSTNVTLYELIFMREIIAEQVTADNLSAITAELGDVATGSIQSTNFSATEGIRIDLTDDLVYIGGSTSPKLKWDSAANLLSINAAVSFASNSSGYTNISDKPTDLSDINSTEGTKLTGIATGADVTDYSDDRVSNNKTENNLTTISRPGGATYSVDTAVTGAIKITLPQSWTSTMMKFVVDVYNYATNKSFSLNLAGYAYNPTSAWHSTVANLVGSAAADNRVRFGHDGTKCCILIGETTSSWSFLKINVRDFQAGRSNYTIDHWDDGWSIELITDDSGITTTADHSDALIDAASILNQGDLAIQDRSNLDYTDGADVTGSNTAADIAGQGNLATQNTAAYATDVTGTPTSLSGINSTEGTKLTGIATGADVTADNTANNAANYTGANIATGYTAAKCTDANADQTSANTSYDTARVNALAATTLINGGYIGTNLVVANSINVSYLSAISANLGTITAGNITINSSGYIRGGQTAYATGTGFWAGYSGGAYKVSFGSAANYIRADSTNVYVGGKIVQPSNITDYAAGNYLVGFADTERTTQSTSLSKIKEVYIPRGGTLRIKFDFKGIQTDGGNAYIYRNGAVVGALRKPTHDWVTHSQDIGGNSDGDLLQLYYKSTSGYTVYVRNFRLYASDSLMPGTILN